MVELGRLFWKFDPILAGHLNRWCSITHTCWVLWKMVFWTKRAVVAIIRLEASDLLHKTYHYRKTWKGCEISPYSSQTFILFDLILPSQPEPQLPTHFASFKVTTKVSAIYQEDIFGSKPTVLMSPLPEISHSPVSGQALIIYEATIWGKVQGGRSIRPAQEAVNWRNRRTMVTGCIAMITHIN